MLEGIEQAAVEASGFQDYSVDWEMDSVSALLGKAWVKSFQSIVNEAWALSFKDKVENFKLEYKSAHRATNYNNSVTDWVTFVLDIDNAILGNIVNYCLVDNRDLFEGYLLSVHSSRDGYISYMDTDIEAYDEAWDLYKKSGRPLSGNDRPFWAFFDFFFLRYGLSTEFNEILWGEVMELVEAGEFDACVRVVDLEGIDDD
jgi:hypothetical protein